ncbi:MFS transporter [Leptolinea sp. HRD-7]|jgi:predicted MFS family arabinose efflux permease|nr:MFS transporter [Leptolinea sp. HRD-7]
MKFKYLSSGWKTFYRIWFGQTVSLIGTAMSRFAFMIWAYQQTGAATTLALLGFFGYGSLVVTSVFSGSIVDRFNRKYVMLLADTGAALTSAVILLLYITGHLQIWHLYAMEVLSGFFDAFQYPAYQASITLLVPKDDFTRASSMTGLSDSSSRIIAPVLAGLILPLTGIQTVLLIDLATFIFAFINLAYSPIPQPEKTHAREENPRPEFFSRAGWDFIRTRPGLVGLVVLFAFINLCAGFTYYSIISPMILARSGNNTLALSWVEASLGVGGVVGGILLSLWGGPKKRVPFLLLATAISFILGDGSFAFGRSLPMWMLAGFISNLSVPYISSPNQAVWQAKTPPELQGRVFALRGMLQMVTIPIGFLMAGPLADRIFEPGMMPDGWMSPLFGWISGVGPGAGMGLMFACSALGGCLTGLIGLCVPSLRNVERDLPDAV